MDQQFKIYNIEQFFSLDPLAFIEEMSNTDDLFFLLFWYYYDEHKSIKPILSTSLNDYRFVRTARSAIFLSDEFVKDMINNYKRYIGKVIFRYEGDKNKLLVQAELLLNSKFYMVGKKIVGTRIVEKILDVISLLQFFQKCICNNLYEMLLEEFSKLETQSLIPNNSKQVKRHLEYFEYVARHIWNNREELFGLRWLATQPRKIVALYLLVQGSFLLSPDEDLINLLLENKIENNIDRFQKNGSCNPKSKSWSPLGRL